MIESRKAHMGQGGFTLIELLVVVAILAVLGGAAIIGIGAMRGNAQEQVCKTDLKTIRTAAEAYRVSEDAVPADVAALIAENYVAADTDPGWTISVGANDVITVANNGAYNGFDANCTPV